MNTTGNTNGAKLVDEAPSLPITPTNRMMNAAVNAWHSWKSRNNGGNIQELGRLMWEHMADAAPKPGDWEYASGGALPRAVNLPEFQEATWGINSVMRPCKSMAISEYAFRQWAKDVGIVLADGVEPVDGQTALNAPEQ